MGVVRGWAREAGEVGGEEVGAGAVGAPRGEARRDALLALGLADGLLELDRVGAVDEDAGVGRHELVDDAGAAAGGHVFLRADGLHGGVIRIIIWRSQYYRRASMACTAGI